MPGNLEAFLEGSEHEVGAPSQGVTHTHSHTKGSSGALIYLTHMCFDCRKKLEYPEKTPTFLLFGGGGGVAGRYTH